MCARLADDQQELRIALVMNGGVSLAVWMGGVTRELDRLRLGDGLYGELLELTRTRARIDVIAGASAGGINGAVLALAIARGNDVSTIRDLWMREGAIARLLRNPMERDAPSLLNGDGNLLAGLREALGDIGNLEGREPPPADRVPLHLTITGTALKGLVTSYVDHFGAVIPDIDHRIRFRFRRGRVGEAPTGNAAWPDDFAPGDPDVAVAQLALAARSSASFPAAFEPSFCPTEKDETDAEHPVMGAVGGFDDARWVIDGGVLVNTPFRPALDAIATLPAEGPVRRVLGYVVPHPVPAVVEPDARAALPSTLRVVGDAMSRLPRVQSIGRELEDIEANNRRVDRRRDARASTLAGLDGRGLQAAAELLVHGYVQVRGSAAADDIATLMLEGHRAFLHTQARREARGHGVRYFADPWRDVPRADDVARVRGRLEELGRGRWIPAVEPAEWGVLDLRTWDWGIAPVEYAANVVLDVLRSAVAMPELRTRWHDVRGMRAQLHRILDRLRRVQRASADHWREAGSSKQAFGEASARELADYAARWAAGFQEELGELAGRLAVLLGRAWRRLDQHRDAGAVQDLLASLDPLAADERAAVPPRERLRRLLALDVVQRTPSADLSGIEQAIELVLMSADAQNAFRPTAKAEDKLAGLQVGHFGAFYKQSWRANDWMWGRLDGADRVVRTLVDPFRIQRLLRDGADLDEVVRRVRAIAVDTPVNEPREWLRSEWRSCEDAVRTELRELLRPGREPKSTDLPATYAALRRRVQLEIVLAELPAVRSAVVADRNEGTAPNAQGDLWEAGLPPPKSLGVAETIAAFRSCPIGAERIPSEVGSDHFTEVSTRALAVTGSVVGASLSVVKPLRPALATLRGVLLALFLLGRGVVASTRSSNFLVALVLAAGGALFAVFLLGTRVPGALGLLGATLLIAGVVLAALRRTWARLVLTALVFVAATLGYRHWHDHPGWLGSTAGVVAVVLMALSAMALGYTRKPRFRRLHRLRRWMHERRAERRRGQQPTGAPDWDV